MTHANNYNTNACGPDIEVSCFYDNDASRMNFDDNISIVSDSRRGPVVAFYHGQGPGHDDIEWAIKGNKKEMTRFLWTECDNWYENISELKAMKKENIIDDILEFFAQNTGLSLNTYEENQEWFTPLRSFPNNTDPARYDIEITPQYKGQDITLDYHASRGYSQGDYCKVYYSLELLTQAWGNKPDINALHTSIDHTLWDSPVYCRVTIDGDEYYYFDQPEYDEYDWYNGRDKFIEWLSSETGINRAEFDALIPEYPEYT